MKRACLDDAWDLTQAVQNQSLRDSLRQNESAARKIVAGGSLASVSANGRQSAFAYVGPGQLTPLEVVELWRDLIDRHDISKDWLLQNGLRGLDPNATELQGFTCPAPAITNPTYVVQDVDIYNWMMAHLIPIYEARSDYSELTTGAVPWI